MKLENVVLPDHNPNERFDIEISQNTIQSITRSARSAHEHESPPSLLVPTLCHPHIHLDKPYLLTSHAQASGTAKDDLPDYSDLVPSSGTFAEALANTSKAKTRYTVPDLLLRGSQLIAESVAAGVTDMRAFVEVDHVTGFKCLDAAVQLKQRFSNVCHVQIVAFAQDPVFSTEHGEKNRELLMQALDLYKDHIEVLGSTPYVEVDYDTGVKNVEWAVQTAVERKLHLDFHLDYNVSEEKWAMVWDVVRVLKELEWTKNAVPGKTIVLGHCTRMSTFSDAEMRKLAKDIHGAQLPIHFVGLPTSDMFMMGRPGEDDGWGGRRERGTLQVLEMIKRFDMNACIGVNNVGNAFTPWGTADPVQLACLGVGVYQAGTEKDAGLLFECVSTRARQAIGLAEEQDQNETQGNKAATTGPWMLVRNVSSIQCSGLTTRVPARQKLTLKDIIWDPPKIESRKVIKE